jgi:hypothetical protein
MVNCSNRFLEEPWSEGLSLKYIFFGPPVRVNVIPVRLLYCYHMLNTYCFVASKRLTEVNEFFKSLCKSKV